ncbi:transcriptional activator protein [Diplodia corticola]|uniref:Transcriptional activator protein n=1 Tax=Diplodia corticola TaxID=236234 RepID=A0A1J9S5M2_9PEZI|nr:transcriptional activator protein [Diplodia corticola]OJD35244.1 transcriptional activator protein [Diplodia corticola]
MTTPVSSDASALAQVCFYENEAAGERRVPLTTSSTWNQPESAKSPPAEPVIGHMGRLVLNDQQVPMFAGSSTGVHFISQAEQKLQMLNIHPESLPSRVYSLYLNSVCNAPPTDPSPHLAASFIAHFPPNAEHIISNAIDQWTPLYPIVHKQSTLAAFRSLLQTPNTGDHLCTIYQTLILLALGSVGSPCSNPTPHPHHFLCSSDPYYALSTALTANLLEHRPCLPALQALVLAQIYLQLSARYPAASHLCGTAVRLAQTLGLHRHSARFKFDAPTTEARRRAWWCVYALDAFASAHHGMPRLIRDRDVDADMVTRVEWYRCEGEGAAGREGEGEGEGEAAARITGPRSHEPAGASSSSSFPLPGEHTPIDSAIALFKLAAVLGHALELLYTTTRRRGSDAVRTIARLQAQLDVWEQHHLAPLLLLRATRGGGRDSSNNNNVVDDDDDSPPPAGGRPAGGGADVVSIVATTFLRAALCNATVHVHRPALAFTAPHPQFADSLRACGRASAGLVGLLDGALGRSASTVSGIGGGGSTTTAVVMATLLYPNGLHMLWQAGLTVLFAWWNGVGGDRAGDEAVVVKCAEVLRRLAAGASGGGGGEGDDSVRKCADVLDVLRVRTFGDKARRKEKGLGVFAAATAASASAAETTGSRPRSPVEELLPPEQQMQWNVWDWPMASALELANTLDAMPLDLDFEGGDPSW